MSSLLGSGRLGPMRLGSGPVSTTYVSVANSVALYLAAQSYPEGITLTAGTNLFANLIPDAPDQVVAVFERSGASPLLTMTGYSGLSQSLLDRPVIQIRVRAAANQMATGNTLMQQVWGILQGLAGTEVPSGGLEFLLITAAGFPQYLGQDTRQRPEWSINLTSIMQNTQRVPAG